MAKAKSDDWVNLAGAALGARDGLRRALGELQAILDRSGDPETRTRVEDVLRAVAREIDRLRFALKDRGARYRRAA
jgi:hypothetical protein